MKLYAMIATHGRCDLLRRTLKSLAACARPACFEYVLVVENASDAGARQICADMADELPLRYEHIDPPGAARARQWAIDQLGEGFVIFLDDDVRVVPQLFELYAQAAEAQGTRTFYGGPLPIDYESAPPDWLRPHLPASVNGWTPRDPADPFADGQMFLGANLGVFIETIQSAGGFDVHVGPGSQRVGAKGNPTGHEMRLQQRLLKAGCKPCYLPEAKVWHYVPRTHCSPSWALHRTYRNWITMGMTRPMPEGARLWGVPRWMWRKAAVLGCRAALAYVTPSGAARFAMRKPYYEYRGLLEGMKLGEQQRRKADEPAAGAARRSSDASAKTPSGEARDG